ncbi:Get3/ArsA fold putative tail anchor-mediating ATPase NosAFP [Scytonema millei]|uniref:ArsA family ATPase n=1 Tax=Scytonema millei VB511283 TaxID=1245923 RepID=A0A9X5I3P7_9CYAN|nr:ArsA family ATPase [Scytonema millei]NHC33707.1 ArsA family ATPase [Scytonema millei VB511283]
MPLILTFLGKGGTGRTTIAIAAAKRLASQGQRVLLATDDNQPGLGLLLDTSLAVEPQEVATNLQVVQLKTSTLLERNWDEVKKLEAQYLRTPIIKDVYGQELVVLPGMDKALVLNALREYDASGKYDAIVFDGSGDSSMLRLLGMPESLSWYARRFGKLLTDSDLGRTVSPFLQPLLASIFNVSWTGDNFSQPTSKVTNILEQGKAALADPKRLAAYLVVNDNPASMTTARYLWGSSQLIGLTIAGAIANQSTAIEALKSEFSPLPVSSVPTATPGDWQLLIDALPDFTQPAPAPKPLEIDVAARQVRVFLPGFDKKQVKLTQSGSEITIEAGDHRRNIILPPGLSGKTVTGAKFQQGYLIVSL